MRNKTILAVLIGIFAIAVLGGAALILQPFEPPAPAGSQSSSAGQDKKLQTQIEAYESLIEENPDDPKYHQGLADLYWSVGEWEKAAEHYANALALKPEDGELRLMTAMARWHAGQVEQAIGLLQEAVERDPEDPTAQFYLGMLLANQEGREAEAVAALRRAIELAGDSELALQARRRLAELGAAEQGPARSADGSAASPSASASGSGSGARAGTGAETETGTEAEVTRIFPRTLGGLRLVEAYGGARAKREIERMHGGKVTIERGFVAFYSGAGGERSATFWVSEAASEQEALDLVRKMKESIARGGTPFSPLESIAVPGLEAIPVYLTRGMGQFHYIWVKKQWIVWVAMDEPSPERRLELLKAAIVLVG